MLHEFVNVVVIDLVAFICLDKFHAVRKISRIFSPKNEMARAVYEEAKLLFAEGKYLNLMCLLTQKWFIDSAKNLRLIQWKKKLKESLIKIIQII